MPNIEFTPVGKAIVAMAITGLFAAFMGLLIWGFEQLLAEQTPWATVAVALTLALASRAHLGLVMFAAAVTLTLYPGTIVGCFVMSAVAYSAVLHHPA